MSELAHKQIVIIAVCLLIALFAYMVGWLLLFTSLSQWKHCFANKDFLMRVCWRTITVY